MADYSALEAIEKRILASGRKPTRADQRTLAPLLIERRKKKEAEEDAIVKARQPKTRAEAVGLSRRGLLKSREQILSEYAAEKQKEKQKSSNVPVTANVPSDDIRAMNQPTGNALSFRPVADEKTPSAPIGNVSTEIEQPAEKRKIIPAGRTRSEESTQLSSVERKMEAPTAPVTDDVPSYDIRAMNQPTGNALSFEPVADEKTPSAPMGNVSTEIGEPEPVELDENRMAQLYRKTTGAEYNPEVSKAAREKMAQLKAFVSTNPEMLNKSDTRIALDFYKTLK